RGRARRPGLRREDTRPQPRRRAEDRDAGRGDPPRRPRPAPAMSDAGARVPSPENAVAVDGVSKRFGEVAALDGISFAVAPGEIFLLIGPDGAGKNTLFRINNNIIVPDAGTAREQ